jgi:hypothetical protein
MYGWILDGSTVSRLLNGATTFFFVKKSSKTVCCCRQSESDETRNRDEKGIEIERDREIRLF